MKVDLLQMRDMAAGILHPVPMAVVAAVARQGPVRTAMRLLFWPVAMAAMAKNPAWMVPQLHAVAVAVVVRWVRAKAAVSMAAAMVAELDRARRLWTARLTPEAVVVAAVTTRPVAAAMVALA